VHFFITARAPTNNSSERREQKRLAAAAEREKVKESRWSKSEWLPFSQVSPSARCKQTHAHTTFIYFISVSHVGRRCWLIFRTTRDE
jgi:hypothetical protein